MANSDFISEWISDFDLEEDPSTPCRIQYFDDHAYIIDQKNNVWVKISSVGCNVEFKIFPQNIPTEYIGKKTQEKIEGTILCESPEQAKLCVSAMLSFIENGYGEKRCWLIGLDMEDLAIGIFNGTTIKFLHKTIHFPPNEEIMGEIKSKTKDSSVVLTSFISPEKDSWGWDQLETINAAIEQMMKADSTFCWQVSLNENAEKCTFDIWYR